MKSTRFLAYLKLVRGLLALIQLMQGLINFYPITMIEQGLTPRTRASSPALLEPPSSTSPHPTNYLNENGLVKKKID